MTRVCTVFRNTVNGVDGIARLNFAGSGGLPWRWFIRRDCRFGLGGCRRPTIPRLAYQFVDISQPPHGLQITPFAGLWLGPDAGQRIQAQDSLVIHGDWTKAVAPKILLLLVRPHALAGLVLALQGLTRAIPGHAHGISHDQRSMYPRPLELTLPVIQCQVRHVRLVKIAFPDPMGIPVRIDDRRQGGIRRLASRQLLVDNCRARGRPGSCQAILDNCRAGLPAYSGGRGIGRLPAPLHGFLAIGVLRGCG